MTPIATSDSAPHDFAAKFWQPLGAGTVALLLSGAQVLVHASAAAHPETPVTLSPIELVAAGVALGVVLVIMLGQQLCSAARDSVAPVTAPGASQAIR